MLANMHTDDTNKQTNTHHTTPRYLRRSNKDDKDDVTEMTSQLPV